MTKHTVRKRTYCMISLAMAFLMFLSFPALPASAETFAISQSYGSTPFSVIHSFYIDALPEAYRDASANTSVPYSGGTFDITSRSKNSTAYSLNLTSRPGEGGMCYLVLNGYTWSSTSPSGLLSSQPVLHIVIGGNDYIVNYGASTVIPFMSVPVASEVRVNFYFYIEQRVQLQIPAGTYYKSYLSAYLFSQTWNVTLNSYFVAQSVSPSGDDLVSRIITNINNGFGSLMVQNTQNTNQITQATKDQTDSLNQATKDQTDSLNQATKDQTDTITDGYDTSQGSADNDRLSGSLGSLEEMEDKATGSAVADIKGFSFGDILDFSANILSAMTFIASFVERFLYASNEFQVVPVVIYALAFLVVVTGIFRFVRGAVSDGSKGG